MATKRAKKEEKAPKKVPEAEEKAKPDADYTVKQKPKLTADRRRSLRLRRRMSDKRPRFLRDEWFRHPRLGMIWRKPQGDHSKMRTHWRYRTNVPSVGYRGPADVRGLHPSGFEEVLVHNPGQVKSLDPDRQAVRIGSGVGLRKRALIQAAAEEKGLRVLNGVSG